MRVGEINEDYFISIPCTVHATKQDNTAMLIYNIIIIMSDKIQTKLG